MTPGAAPTGRGGPDPDAHDPGVTDTAPLRLYWRIAGRARGRTNRNGMRTTLERIKAVVEADGTAAAG